MPLPPITPPGDDVFVLGSSQRDDLPTGTYKAVFQGLTKIETPTAKTPHAFRWTFRVIEGDHEGQTISGLSDTDNPTPNNRFGKWLVALAKAALKPGTQVVPSEYVGRTYTVFVEPTPKGGTRIATFFLT